MWQRLLIAIAFSFVAFPTSAASAQGSAVVVFPTPGSRMATPTTQIAFRGVPASQLGTISVAGSQSGIHKGLVEADSDGLGGSFIPSGPFLAGETVTVTSGLNILGAPNGTFHFTVAVAAGSGSFVPRPTTGRVRGDVMRFRSRPDLIPAAVQITTRSALTAPGDIFLAPQRGPVQYGPTILDPSGSLVWFDPLPAPINASDFRVQNYLGRPVLTWWQGRYRHGHGDGTDIIMDSSYRQIAAVTAANGLAADEHEFQLTPWGTALIDAFHAVSWNATSVHGSTHQDVLDGVVQEIDIRTGLVLFQWDSLDHVPLRRSSRPPSSAMPYDYFHINSIAADRDGTLLVSSRNTSAIYKIDRRTGDVIWTLGGKRSSFRMGPGASFTNQHDVRVLGNHDRYLTLFDDGGGLPRVESESRGLKLRLDLVHKTATIVAQYKHVPPLVANFEGSDEQLPNGDNLVGWGETPAFSEFSPSGQLIFDAHTVSYNSLYRVYRLPWHGRPLTPPTFVIARRTGGISTVYVSWNGATDVASWRVLAGPSASALARVATASRHGFETAIAVHSEQPAFAVKALDSRGQVLGTSPVRIATRARVSLFGHSAFVTPAGVGTLSVGCFATQPCRLTATLAAGKTTVAVRSAAAVAANSGGIVSFRLGTAGRALLSHAAAHRLRVTATIRNADGAGNSTPLTLILFRTTGKAPPYAVHQSPSVQLFGRQVFVSHGGVAGIFSGCASARPCAVRTILSAGGTVIARTRPESLAGADCGIVFFTLNAAGRAMLAHAAGNQLPARVTAANGRDIARADVTLVSFS